MVDAVNAAISSLSSLPVANRGVQAAVVTAETARVDAPKAPFISPYIHVDLNYDKAVLQIRDSDTGDVVEQFPSSSRLQQLKRAQALGEQARELAGRGQAAPTPDEVQSREIEFSSGSGLGAQTLVAAQSSSEPTSPASGPSLPQVAISALSASVQQPVASSASQLV